MNPACTEGDVMTPKIFVTWSLIYAGNNKVTTSYTLGGAINNVWVDYTDLSTGFLCTSSPSIIDAETPSIEYQAVMQVTSSAPIKKNSKIDYYTMNML